MEQLNIQKLVKQRVQNEKKYYKMQQHKNLNDDQIIETSYM